MTADVAVKAASNPAVQNAAVSAAKNPAVQKAAVNHMTGQNDVEAGRPSSSGNNGGDFDPADVQQMKKFHTFLRVGFIVTSIMMALAASLTLQSGTNASTAFIAFYVFFFAVVMFCFECGLKSVAKLISSNFGFMYTLSGRFLFLCIVSGMCIKLSTVGIVCVGCIALCMVGYAYVLFQCPNFEEYLRKKHYYAEKDFA